MQGDSGFAVFRKKQLIFQSEPLQHFFDCPLQFAGELLCPTEHQHRTTPPEGCMHCASLQCAQGSCGLTRLLPDASVPSLWIRSCAVHKVAAASQGCRPTLVCPDPADSESSTDKAEDATLSELELQPGDLIVMATDGVWDNLYMDELISLLPKSPEDLQRVSLGAESEPALAGLQP